MAALPRPLDLVSSMARRLPRENSAGSASSGGTHWRDSVAPDVVVPKVSMRHQSSTMSQSSRGSWREAIAPDVAETDIKVAVRRQVSGSSAGSWRESIAPDVVAESR
mmetsp:Transcript_57165/g.123698  ORF Transcript_57165/g.123698 Transcript_57165/m.123698 type:complete len:107 (+) Transcript_57165:66-386(+)